MTGNIKSGIPKFQPPPFSFNDTSTEPNTFYAFGDMLSELGGTGILIPLLAILNTVTIAKVFCKYSFKSLEYIPEKFFKDLLTFQCQVGQNTLHSFLKNPCLVSERAQE